MEKNYIIVKCPHCGKEMDIPYVYDGTYEILHTKEYYKGGSYAYGGCQEYYYVAILDGKLHVHRTKESLQEFLRVLR
jgi:hypothetical protein